MAKHSTYLDRALRARDPRYARILTRLGYTTRDAAREQPVSPSAPIVQPVVDDEASLSALRAEYQRVVGKRPFHGWGADELRERIEKARSE